MSNAHTPMYFAHTRPRPMHPSVSLWSPSNANSIFDMVNPSQWRDVVCARVCVRVCCVLSWCHDCRHTRSLAISFLCALNILDGSPTHLRRILNAMCAIALIFCERSQKSSLYLPDARFLLRYVTKRQCTVVVVHQMDDLFFWAAETRRTDRKRMCLALINEFIDQFGIHQPFWLPLFRSLAHLFGTRSVHMRLPLFPATWIFIYFMCYRSPPRTRSQPYSFSQTSSRMAWNKPIKCITSRIRQSIVSRWYRVSVMRSTSDETKAVFACNEVAVISEEKNDTQMLFIENDDALSLVCWSLRIERGAVVTMYKSSVHCAPNRIGVRQYTTTLTYIVSQSSRCQH